MSVRNWRQMAEQMEVEGDSSQNSLASVQRSYRALMKDKLERNESMRPTSNAGLAALKKKNECLTEELIKLQAIKTLRERLDDIGQDEDTHDETVLRQRTKDKEEELISVKARHYQDVQCLQCLQQRECLHNHLFTQTGPTHPIGVEIEGLLDTQLGLVKKILVCSREVEEARERLSEVREERRTCMENCRQTAERIETLHTEDRAKSNTVNDEESRQSELDRVSREISLLTHSLQCLITGSSVDWASDAQLLELTIKLGDIRQWL